MISAGFGGNSVQFMKKIPTMNFFEAVEKIAEITGIVLEVTKSKTKTQRKFMTKCCHMKIVQYCSDSIKKFKSLKITLRRKK
jgi:DNA primase